MRINTNIASLNAQANNAQTNMTLQNSLEKLSSGLKINKAADDASGMAIADKLRTQASSIGQGIQNANSASALIQIADKAMSEQSNILDIVKTKLLQAATSTTSAEGREAVRKDVQKLLEQMNNISTQTTYNGVNLLDNQGQEFNFQVGEKSTDIIGLTTEYAVNTTGLGATESISSDTESKLGFGSIASATAIIGKTDISLQNNTTEAASDAMAGISLNHATSSAAFNATTADTSTVRTSVDIEGKGITRLVLETVTDGTASEVMLHTEDAALIAALDAAAGGASLTGSGGDYIWSGNSGASATDSANGVISFGSGIDITDLTISNISISSDGSKNNEITIVTENEVKVTQTGEAQTALAVDSVTVDTKGDTTLTGTLIGTGGSDNGGVVHADDANITMSLREGTTTVKVDQTTGSVDKAQIAIGSTTVGMTGAAASNHDRDAAYTLSADNVTKLSMGGTDSVTLSTTDLSTMSTLAEAARNNGNLTEISAGTYQFTGTGANNDLIFSGAGVDLSQLTIAGQKMGTETLYVQTNEAVSITKKGDEYAQNISIAAAADGTVGTEQLRGVQTDTSAISGSLDGLMSVLKDGLTADVANSYMETIDSAMTQLNSVRSDFGSTQNQLSSATRNMMVTQVNIKAAESVIRDVDYAAESANFNKQNIISQAGTYAMSQANQVQQNIMRLLQ